MNSSRQWSKFKPFLSTATVQKCLERNYERLEIPKASECSYQNSYPLTYCVMHAESFFLQGSGAPVSLKPILFFYGLVQLIKACILTIDPYYPETSSVLAHGVSTRKRKKQQYQFLDDEVKIQKNGLYAHACFKLFDLKGVEADKFSMLSLMKKIPEMQETFSMIRGQASLIPVHYKDNHLFVPSKLADDYHITPERLSEYLCNELNLSKAAENNNKELLTFQIESPINPFYSKKLMFNQQLNHFALPLSKEDFYPLPELLSHYLLLYNLSMISRYETEWWYDLLLSHSNDDLVYISSFLEITEEKIPFLMWSYLGGMLANT